jgi:enoyl-CoA hydratase/carnithine racemase
MTWLLPRIVGLGRAMYLTLSSEPIDAEEAAAIGLIDRVTQAETVLDEAKDFARRIASYPRTGVEWIKIGYMRALESDFATATRNEEAAELACFQSPETRARFRAFIERQRG